MAWWQNNLIVEMKRIRLDKSPDPEAYVEISATCLRLPDTEDSEASVLLNQSQIVDINNKSVILTADVHSQETDHLRKTIQQLTRQLDESKQAYKEVAEQKNRLGKELSSVQKMMDKKMQEQKTVGNYFQLYNRAQERIATQEQQLNRLEVQLAECEIKAKMEFQNQIDQLQRDKSELELQLAMSNNRIAMLFNSAYEIGGEKLLDQLQNSAGLREQ